jgi:lysophospholipase L1-like esterase
MRRLPYIGMLGAMIFLLAGYSAAQQRICYFGDSITEGWIDAERQPAAAWPALLDSLLAQTGIRYRSLRVAHGGETTTDACRRIDDDVLPFECEAAIVAFGSNDMYIWDNPPSLRVGPPLFREQLRLIVRKLQGSGARVLLLGMPPMLQRRFYRFADSSLYAPYGGASALQRRYESIMRDVAAAEAAEYLSLEEAYADNEALLGIDGVHPSRAGHAVIADALLPRLLVMLQSALRRFVPDNLQVYPSPVTRERNPLVTIRFQAASGSRVEASIVDISGRVIRKIVYFTHTDGTHFLAWDGRDGKGTRASAGAYTVHVRIADRTTARTAGRTAGRTAQQRILLM